MMVSDLVALVGHFLRGNISFFIVKGIAMILVGSLTHKIVTGIDSNVTLTVASLVALLVWIQVRESQEGIWIFLCTTSLVVVGYEVYQRLLGRYK